MDEISGMVKNIFLVLVVGFLFMLPACKGENDDVSEANMPEYSPLRIMLVDLDGDGPDIVHLEESEIYFDVEGSGKAKKTAWVGTDDGLMRIFTIHHLKLPDEKRVFASLDVGLDILKPYDVDGNSIIDSNEIYKHRQPFNPEVWHGKKLNNVYHPKRPDLFIEKMLKEISIDKDCKMVETSDYKQLCQGHFEWEDGQQADFYIVQFAYEK